MQSVIYAECHLCKVSIMQSVNYAECRKQINYAEGHYAECRWAKCRGTVISCTLVNEELQTKPSVFSPYFSNVPAKI
jgi:hypothetical protein